MSRRSQGARLWLRPAFTGKDGVERQAVWIVRDGKSFRSTGCAAQDREGAERWLADYLAEKHGKPSRQRDGDPSEIFVTQVLSIYSEDVAPKHARPAETIQRILKLGEFWAPYKLADVNGQTCRAYVRWRLTQQWKSAKNTVKMVSEAAARRELEDLRSAINHHRHEGLCREFISVVLPEKSESRETWLTRSQAARLLWVAWRAKQVMRDGATKREVGKHIARFVLVGIYTGTRHRAICGAALQPAIGRGYVDVDQGVFHRRAKGAKKTKKQQPPVRLPDRLLAHIERWKRLGIAKHAVVEWNGKPVRSVKKGFAAAVRAAGLPTTGPDKITPHVLRHTAASWAMQGGGDEAKIADYLGMTLEMLRRVYGHHHPDFQHDTVQAITAKPQKSRAQPVHRMGVNKAR
jgi:integrase